MISDTRSNDKKIENSKRKGMAIISTIMTILKDVSLGVHYYEIAVLLRESLIVNAMLWNIKTWYDLKDHEIEELEAIDRILLRKILEVPFSTPKSYLYLELGILPFKRIIQARRISFLRYILSRKSDDLFHTIKESL